MLQYLQGQNDLKKKKLRAYYVCSGIFIHNPIFLLDSKRHYLTITIPCSACVWISVCIHSAISEKMGSAIVSKNYATFL